MVMHCPIGPMLQAHVLVKQLHFPSPNPDPNPNPDPDPGHWLLAAYTTGACCRYKRADAVAASHTNVKVGLTLTPDS